MCASSPLSYLLRLSNVVSFDFLLACVVPWFRVMSACDPDLASRLVILLGWYLVREVDRV